jgi:predicted HicB family RNase H-like nuclease
MERKMEDPVKFKRIIGGKTYNTETSTLIASHEDVDGPGITGHLFKTRHGAFFLYWFDDGAYFSAVPQEHIKPLTDEEAEAWVEKNAPPEVYEAEFGEAPEAGDPEARITLRIPETLRKKAARKAEEQGQSLNAWILRCLERGVSEEGRA